MFRSVAAGLVALLAVGMFGGSLAEHPSRHGYTAAPSAFGHWCEARDRSYVPGGDPEEHGSVEGWLLSGEPECLPGALLHGEEVHHGLAAIVEYSYDRYFLDPGPRIDHRGELAVYTLEDDLEGASVPYHAVFDAMGETVFEAEGCGGFAWQVPFVVDQHWQPGWNYQDMWVWIEPLHITQDLDVCLGTTGTVTVTYAEAAT